MPWPNSWRILVAVSVRGQGQPVLRGEERVERRQPRLEDVELHDHQRQRRRGEHERADGRRRREEPADVRVEPVENPLGVDAPHAEREDVAQRGEQLLAFLLVAALLELPALPRRVGQHQAAAVEHADEVLQLLDANRLRRELGFEPLGDVVEARVAVEHLQDGELLLLEAEVLEARPGPSRPSSCGPGSAAAAPSDPAARGSRASAKNWRQWCRRAWACGGKRHRLCRGTEARRDLSVNLRAQSAGRAARLTCALLPLLGVSRPARRLRPTGWFTWIVISRAGRGG